MNNRQRSKLDSYNRVADFNNKYATEIATIPEYAAEKTAFDTAHALINEAGTVQAAKIGIANNAIQQAKSIMAKTVVKYATRGAVKAKQTGNLALANLLDEPETFIFFTNKTLAVERANSLRDALNENLTTLTNITAANITEIDTAITAYDEIKDDPVEGIQSKKASGTDRLPLQFKTADEAIDGMFALVSSYFTDVNDAMVDELRLAIEIIDTGIRHTDVSIAVLASESDSPIAGAIVEESQGKTYLTNLQGIAEIGSHRSGSFNFTISAANRQPVTFSAIIVRGKENDFTVKLLSNQTT